MMNKNHYVAIMAGGIGSRFWPMSRVAYPKQFLDILHTGKTLLQETHNRFKKFIPEENIFIVTSEEYVSIVKEQIPGFPSKNIVAEPSRKNTAPCIAYISYKLRELNKNGVLICAPSDHLILDETGFTKVCLEAMSFVAAHKALITLGVKPSHPNTGYGYIQFDQQPVSDNVFKVKTFTEKPDHELAKTFVSSGEFLWNAGIFVWEVNNIIKAFEKHLPEIAEFFEAERNQFNTEKEKEAIDKIYPQCTNISIDYGIMEKADNVYIIPSSFGWSDLGTWNSAHDNMEKDYLGNAVAGSDVMVIDATRNMVHVPDHKLVLLQGMDDYIIVDTNDVLLICKKEKEQEIKQYLAEVKRNKGDKFL